MSTDNHISAEINSVGAESAGTVLADLKRFFPRSNRAASAPPPPSGA